jgi:hypothetical protein
MPALMAAWLAGAHGGVAAGPAVITQITAPAIGAAGPAARPGATGSGR